MVPRQELASLEFTPMPAAVLAAVVVASEEKGVRNLPTETVWDVDVPHQANDGRPGYGLVFRAEAPHIVLLQDLGFPVQNQPDGPPSGDDRERLERRIEGQTAQSILLTVASLPPCHEAISNPASAQSFRVMSE